jgi:hypothetical protein
MGHTLASMFAGMLRKQGYEVVEYGCFDLVEFKNFAIEGMIQFDNMKKVHRVRWKCRKGYEIFDVPMAPGYSSSQFAKVGDLLNFLQRRLIWKKQ